MPEVLADFRSDTVTQPTPDMRRAIAEAVVGDDVLGDDPTVLKLQERAAQLLGKEAALFTPSGTMANQIAIRMHTDHGDDLICHKDSHVMFYESGAPAALSGVGARYVDGPRGQFDVADISAVLRPSDSHFAPTTLLIIENTHNRGGGSVWPMGRLRNVTDYAHEHGMACHLDGARLMNAAVATQQTTAELAEPFDTVSMCLSKGLGAPVGSVLAGSSAQIHKAHRFRKMFGGAMRQSGVLAAAALYALDHHVERLAEDHQHAKQLATGLAAISGFSIDPSEVETNILYFDVDPDLASAPALCERFEGVGVRMLPESEERIRAVTHLHISAGCVDKSLEAIGTLLRNR